MKPLSCVSGLPIITISIPPLFLMTFLDGEAKKAPLDRGAFGALAVFPAEGDSLCAGLWEQ